jgi:hypothetical protein
MLLFWRKDFAATSMNDLCDAMGVRSPSLYAAFGSTGGAQSRSGRALRPDHRAAGLGQFEGVSARARAAL